MQPAIQSYIYVFETFIKHSSTTVLYEVTDDIASLWIINKSNYRLIVVELTNCCVIISMIICIIWL